MRHYRSVLPAAVLSRRVLIRSALGMAAAAIVSPLLKVVLAAPLSDAPWPLATDLAADGAAARQSGKPILLYFQRRDCPFCLRAAPYLRALALSHGDQALFRTVEADRPDLPVRDFAGAATNHAALARALHGILTPSVLAVAPNGEPLVAPLVGLADESFYSYYLQRLVEEAAAKTKRPMEPIR